MKKLLLTATHVVSIGSTVGLESYLAGTKTCYLNFNNEVQHHYLFNHLVEIIKSEIVQIVSNNDELFEFVSNPNVLNAENNCIVTNIGNASNKFSELVYEKLS